jgi:hypothetical protein
MVYLNISNIFCYDCLKFVISNKFYHSKPVIYVDLMKNLDICLTIKKKEIYQYGRLFFTKSIWISSRI